MPGLPLATAPVPMGSEFHHLYPKPSRPPHELAALPSPTRLGRTPASTAALLYVLKDNNARWHIFFNNLKYHNHTPATVLALWALGANDTLIHASYEGSSSWQRALTESPNEITVENWKLHLGDIRYYKAYMRFFATELKARGTRHLLQHFLFSSEANFGGGGGGGGGNGRSDLSGSGGGPEMLNRALDAIMHPMINIGHGLEFNVPGMVVDGLAQAAIHHPSSSTLIPPNWWHLHCEDSDASDGDGASVNSTNSGGTKLHSFTILARVLRDPKMGGFRRIKGMKLYEAIMASHGTRVKAYAEQWRIHDDLARSVEELIWLWTLVFGVCGNEGDGRPFNAELFLAHSATSAMFLAPWVAHVSDSAARLLLRAYFSVCLAWYIGRGRPPLDIKRFFLDPTSLRPTIPGTQPTPGPGALGTRRRSSASPPSESSSSSSDDDDDHVHGGPVDESPLATVIPNPWLTIIQAALVHPDEHVPKLQRALKHYAELFEDVEAGYFADTELEGAECIDGTLFLRTAVLSGNRFGWLREGEALSDHAGGDSGYMACFVWDAKGFFRDQE